MIWKRVNNFSFFLIGKMKFIKKRTNVCTNYAHKGQQLQSIKRSGKESITYLNNNNYLENSWPIDKAIEVTSFQEW